MTFTFTYLTVLAPVSASESLAKDAVKPCLSSLSGNSYSAYMSVLLGWDINRGNLNPRKHESAILYQGSSAESIGLRRPILQIECLHFEVIYVHGAWFIPIR